MSQASYDTISKILVQPGRLVKAPTDLTAAFPHGGTSLGLTEDGITLSREKYWEEVTVEEYGIEPVKVVHLGERVSFSVQLAEWTDTTLDLIWSGFTVAGSTSTLKNAEWPGDGATMYPGKDLADNSIILLFSPAVTTAPQKIALFRKAVPVSTTVIELKHKVKSLLACEFIALRDDSIGSGNARYKNRGYFVGDIRDVSIS